MGALIVKIIGLIIIAIGVIGIYDARYFAKKIFSSSDKNASTNILRIVGFIIAVIGAVIIYIV